MLVDDCHWIAPLFPLKVKVVELEPGQTDEPPLTIPPTETVSLKIEQVELYEVEQPPLWTKPH